MRETLSSNSEDYLKAIYLATQNGKLSTQTLADTLGITPPSVTGMIKKLTELTLVEHVPYGGITLTAAGQKIALEIIRHHRLIELYLHNTLGYPLDAVHEEAERLEHVISETFEARIAEALGHPTHDPHGDPIPTKDGKLPTFATLALAALPSGQHAKLGRIAQGDPDFMQYLEHLGLIPGAMLRVLSVNMPASTITVEVNGAEHTMALAVATRLWVNDVVSGGVPT